MASYVFRTSDLPKLDIDTDRGTDFQAWHQQWLAYRSLSGLCNESAAKQVQALQLCFSRETLHIVENLGLTTAQQKDQAQTIAALKAYVDGRVNETIERRNLRQRKQHIGESFDDFLISLRELAKTCHFCSNDCLQKALRDQIIEGLLDGDVIQELLQEKTLTLDDTIGKCRGLESAKKSRHDIQEPPELNAFRTRPNASRRTVTGTCPGCGYGPHDGGRRGCPAFTQACRNCGKMGHFGKVCRQPHPSTRQGPTTPQTTNPQTSTLTISDLSLVQLSELAHGSIVPAPTINMQVATCNGQASLEILPDSGADICAAGPQFVHSLGENMDNLAHSQVSPRAVNGSILDPVGMIPNVSFCTNGKTIQDNVHIYASVTGALISWRTAQKLGILPSCYPSPIGQINACHGPLPTTEQLMSEFPSVFDGQIRTMPGEKFHISLTDDARPFCVSAPRTIPFAYRDKLKQELDLLVAQGVITPVTEPTDWCSPIVVVPKKGTDRIRMCVDLSKLNKFVRREHYPSVTPAEAVTDIQQSRAKFFTVLDALKGYHQCPLDEESQKLTTFITAFGRFMYCRAPYGISSISEHYDRRMDEALSGIQGVRKVVDDVVAFDQDEQQHLQHVREILRHCENKGISLNRDKFKFCQPQAHFAGLTLTPEGYSVSNDIVDAIAKFPTPSSRTDLRSFIGLTNQLASSTNELATILAPLPLLSTRNEFLWTQVHDNAFMKAKQSLSSAPTLAYFDASKETHLYTDASTLGLGFLLLQRQTKNTSDWRVMQAGSRFLTDTETRYAVIELECLAVAWAIKKCHLFLAGLNHFTVITDHNPLISILNSHRLDEIENPRLQRLRTRLMGYKFTAQWLKGANNEAADALSRHPYQQPADGDDLAEHEIDTHHSQAAVYGAPSIAQLRSSTLPPSEEENLQLQELRQHADQDQDYEALKSVITEGFPNQKSSLPDPLKGFWGVKDQLSIDDNLIVYGCRLLIPTSLRATMLSRLHDAHQGIARSQARARLTLYWPGIDRDIESYVRGCRHCQNHLPSNHKEPMMTKPTPDRPFQQVAADFASYGGKQFLILVDCKTDWPDIVEMGKDTTTPRLIGALRDHFCRTAAPDLLWSDGGPQFTSHLLANFLHTWGVKHAVSSPHYPQSNESTVKSMKNLISAAWTGRSINWDTLSRALLQYRNTPCRKDGRSPAQKLFGHPVQDSLPAHRRSFALEWQKSSQDAEAAADKTQEDTRMRYDQHARSLPDIQVGNHVAIQNA